MTKKEYIEREAALHEINSQFPDAHYPSWFAALIEKIPAVDVEPVKHGKWKLHNDGSGTCDQCHHRQKTVWDDDSWQNYCGVCGAKMDVED